MTRAAPTMRDMPTASDQEATPQEQHGKSTTAPWGDGAVPLHDAAEQAREREREARLRLVTGRHRETAGTGRNNVTGNYT